MFPYFLLRRETRDFIERAEKAEVERRCLQAVPWTDDIKYRPCLAVIGSTWRPLILFPELKPVRDSANKDNWAKHGRVSPNGEWAYMLRVLPKHTQLEYVQGKRRGSVVFDSDVPVPIIYQDRHTYSGHTAPWMSLTPQEIITLRGGTRRAKGHTVIAGLGMGYQLIKAAERASVDRLTVVERSQSLVDWLWPVIQPRVRKPVEIVVGDAYKVVPRLKADVALIDIFDSYGNNEFTRCPDIPVVWSWGSVQAKFD